MKVLVILASVIAVGLCAGGWEYVKDPAAQEWCDRLVALDTQYNLISLPDGCPRIVSVEQQVVAGMNYRYIYQKDGRTCMLEFNEVLWLNTRTIRQDNCSIAVDHHAKRGKRACLPGGYCPADPSEQRFMDTLTNFTTMGLLRNTADNGYTIQAVETQVVAGYNYKYTLVDGKGHTCTLVLFVQSWTNTYQVSHDECHLAVHNKRQLAGGYTAQDPTDQEYMTLLNTFTTMGLLQNAADGGLTVQAVATQVVSGMNYRYTLVDQRGHTCTLILYVQVWTKTYRVSHDECHLTVHNKRQLGGYHACSSDAADGLKKCTGMMLDQVNMQSNSMFRMVESGVNAQCKVVQGMEYKIQLTAMPSTCNNDPSAMGYTATECPVDQSSNMAGTTWSAVCWYKAWESPSTTVTGLHMGH